MPPRKHALLPKEILMEMYFDKGLSLSEVSKRTGHNYRCVRDSFRVHGLTWRTKKESQYTRPPVSNETKRKISLSRQGRKDTPEVAERKRQTLASVCNWMEGVPYDDPRRVRQREAHRVAMRRPEVREAISKVRVQQIQAGGFYDRGYYDSIKCGRVYFMSGWELRRWQELDADTTVSSYLRSPCAIPYLWQNSLHRYVPDVLITYMDGSKVLEEIKPLKLLENKHKGQEQLLAKTAAGRTFAATQGWGWRVYSYG